MQPTTALIIFVRNPVLGKVKTRIAAAIGAEKALAVYKKLLEHTHEITKDLVIDKFLFYADYINDEDIWENELYYKGLQHDLELGERMQNAFEEVFKKGYHEVGIIGSDCYQLTQSILEEAFEKLEKTNVVIGPAKDGGYYFIGMSNPIPALFENKEWSTNKVYNDTVTQLKELKIPFHALRVLSDVDEKEDITFKY